MWGAGEGERYFGMYDVCKKGGEGWGIKQRNKVNSLDRDRP